MVEEVALCWFNKTIIDLMSTSGLNVPTCDLNSLGSTFASETVLFAISDFLIDELNTLCIAYDGNTLDSQARHFIKTVSLHSHPWKIGNSI